MSEEDIIRELRAALAAAQFTVGLWRCRYEAERETRAEADRAYQERTDLLAAAEARVREHEKAMRLARKHLLNAIHECVCDDEDHEPEACPGVADSAIQAIDKALTASPPVEREPPGLDAFVAGVKRAAEPVKDVPRRHAEPVADTPREEKEHVDRSRDGGAGRLDSGQDSMAGVAPSVTCTCAAIQAADPARHFKGCPRRVEVKA